MAGVVFLDSSVLFNLLDVPGKNGDRDEVLTEFQHLARDRTTFTFPVAAVIETGNIIAQLADGHARRACMERFVEWLRKALATTAPLAVSGVPWDQSFLTALIDGGGKWMSLVEFATTRVGQRRCEPAFGDRAVPRKGPERHTDQPVDTRRDARLIRLMAPRPYPRTAYLWPPDAGAVGDRVVAPAERAAWLQRRVVVEEKLDGANVVIWREGARLQVASRGGPGAMDRANQLGPLRARVNGQYVELRTLLDGEWALYAEWLWLTHTVHYDRLVALDLWHPDLGFADLPNRDERVQKSGLVGPPRLFAGILGTASALVALMGRSRFGSAPMEGVVLRRDDGEICKVLRPGFMHAKDDLIGRARNSLVGGPREAPGD